MEDGVDEVDAVAMLSACSLTLVKSCQYVKRIEKTSSTKVLQMRPFGVAYSNLQAFCKIAKINLFFRTFASPTDDGQCFVAYCGTPWKKGSGRSVLCSVTQNCHPPSAILPFSKALEHSLSFATRKTEQKDAVVFALKARSMLRWFQEKHHAVRLCSFSQFLKH